MADKKAEKATDNYKPNEVLDKFCHEIHTENSRLNKRFYDALIKAYYKHQEEKGEENVKEGLSKKLYETAHNFVRENFYNNLDLDSLGRGSRDLKTIIDGYHGLDVDTLDNYISNSEDDFYVQDLRAILSETKTAERFSQMVQQNTKTQVEKMSEDYLPEAQDYVLKKAKDVGMDKLEKTAISSIPKAMNVLEMIVRQKKDQERQSEGIDKTQEQLNKGT